MLTLLLLTLIGPHQHRTAAQLSDNIAVQVALDRAGFSPGIIDGQGGHKREVALRAFQRYKGLKPTGQPDAATREALGVDPADAITEYKITWADAKEVGPWPKTWPEKSKAGHLGYASYAALVAAQGHCSTALLDRLNPRMRIDALKPGDTLRIPNVDSPAAPPKIIRLEVDFSEKTISAIDRAGRVAALVHCSIAKEKKNRPSARFAHVACVSVNPEYRFDPKKWPEVKNVKTKLLIPPGPRNPVGLCWMGLSLEGYGIHGTPEPEMIGKTGSHGCFRLANWDALRLAKMIRVGTPVKFVESGGALVASAR